MANQLTIRNKAAGAATAQKLTLAIATVAASQVLAFPADAQPKEVSAACKVCATECGTPIFYPEGGGCPNPIFYPESMAAIGAALVVGFIAGAWVARNKQIKNQ